MSARGPHRYLWQLGGLSLLVAILLVISPGIGPDRSVGFTDAWRNLVSAERDGFDYAIAWQIRFPRAVKALLVGLTLAMTGAVFQTLLRNPLATPYTMGISSGASLGAMLAFQAGWVVSYAGLSSVALAAFGGAGVVLLLVLALARSAARITGNTLLLAGVTIGLFCSGLMVFVTSLADVVETHKAVRWMMGSMDTFGHVELSVLLPFLVPAWIAMLALAPGLNQFAVGDELAASRGVHVRRLEVTGLLAGSLAVAAVVALCGPVGFVGLIVPHLTRLLTGADHRLLLPASGLVGAAFLMGCDFLAVLTPGWYGAITGRQTSAAQLPIGVMTALIGTPIFLVLLCRRRTG